MCLCGGWTEETSSSADLCGLHLAIVISATAIHSDRTQKVKTTLKLLLVFPETAPPAGSKTSTPLLFAQSTRAPVSRRKGHGPANIRPIQHRSRRQRAGNLCLGEQPRRQLQGSSHITLGLGLGFGVAGPRLPRCFLPLEWNRNCRLPCWCRRLRWPGRP